MVRFRLVPERSSLAIDARSNVGPIRWEAAGLRGGFEVVEASPEVVDPRKVEWAEVELSVESLTSGNSLYDAELQRRIDGRAYPTARVALRHVDPVGTGNRYQLQGDLTFHGVTRLLTGTVVVAFPAADVALVYGEKVIDIRDFDVPSPAVLMLKILPDVRVRMSLEAQRDD
ncbi:MAG: YceI-like domain [Actinomycetota bacterium]|jgi:polyisoprenoid-binding protein YceI|nr:YceI-like domain [Actinomycetota bacterium]